MSSSKEYVLNASCILGAMAANNQVDLDSFYAHLLTQPDPTNSLSQNYYYSEVDKHMSTRLNQVTQASGGLLPDPNPFIGAPMCTFVFGAIKGGVAYPTLPLIVGPSAEYYVYDNNTESLEDSSGWIAYKNDYFTRTNAANFYTSIATVGDLIGKDGEAPINYDIGINIFGIQNASSFPFIPFNNDARFSDAPILPTYNIWRSRTIEEANETNVVFVQNIGYVYETGYTGQKMSQIYTGDHAIPSIYVDALGGCMNVERIYPISKDLAYSGAYLYYSSIPCPASVPTSQSNGTYSTYTPPRQPIQARSDAHNCGFQLHFKFDSIPGINYLAYQSNSYAPSPGFSVYFGDPDPSTSHGDEYTSQFWINFTPGNSPMLRYRVPSISGGTQNNSKVLFNNFPLQGMEFSEETSSCDLYVHFAGPFLLIGFDTNVNKWNVFKPIQDTDPSGKSILTYKPYLSNLAVCRIQFTNCSATFQYGPAAFNNYNVDEIVNNMNINPSANPGYGYSKVNTQIMVAAGLTNTSDSPLLLAAGFTHRQTPLDIANDVTPKTQELMLDNPPNPPGVPVGASLPPLSGLPTVYRDSRENPSNCLVTYNPVSSDYQTSSYDKNKVAINTPVIFNTTIEGPMFHKVGNLYPDQLIDPITGKNIFFQNQNLFSSSVYQKLNNKFTDVPNPVTTKSCPNLAEYITNFTVEYTLDEETFYNFVRGTATITLNNFDSNVQGLKLYNYIRANKLTVSLGAGYNGKIQTYFEGAINGVTYHTGKSGSVITLTCLDIGNTIFDGTRVRGQVDLSACNAEEIIAHALAAGGVLPWYKPNNRNLILIDGTYKLQNGFPVPSNKDLNNPYWLKNSYINLYYGMSAPGCFFNTQNTIKDIITTAFHLCQDDTYYPVFYYDYADGFFKSDFHLQGIFQDNLYFIGSVDSKNISYLPFKSRHGVLTENGFTIESAIDKLYSGYMIVSKDLNAVNIRVTSDQDQNSNDYQASNDPNSIDILKAGLGINHALPNIGYVGMNKEKYYPFSGNDQLFSTQSLQNYAKIVTPMLRKVYEEISFSCYITQPLTPWGYFVLNTDSGDNSDNTSGLPQKPYFYKYIKYTFDKENNILTAEIVGTNYVNLQGSI